ncbi:MAG TPA: hypothetical protein VHJ20_16560 [Polyangia bacterium]|nr:hypothetical protein [Polyangia bacterium]
MSRLMRCLLAFSLVALVVGATASTAQAQQYYRRPPPPGYGPPPGYYPPPPAYYPRYRNGLVVGFAIGGGGISASDCLPGYCGGAFSGEFHIGGMLTDRLALEGDIWGNVRGVSGTDGSLAQTFWSAALQFWPIEPLWLKGGLGIAHIPGDDAAAINDETALGLMLAAGVEVVQIRNFAFDIQLRFGHGFYSDADGGGLTNYALLFGFNWY